MPKMTGNRYFAEAVQAHGISHVFFVPTIMIPAMAEMEDMNVRRVVTHGYYHLAELETAARLGISAIMLRPGEAVAPHAVTSTAASSRCVRRRR